MTQLKDPMRLTYKMLTDSELEKLKEIKRAGACLWDILEGLEQTREIALAKTKVEEAVMWAVKSIT